MSLHLGAAPEPPPPVLPPDVEALARRLLALKRLPKYVRVVLERYVKP